MNYLLDGKKVVEVPDILDWAKGFEKMDRVVAKTKNDKVRVSTVFLGVDHSFRDEGPPLLFETMIFCGEHDGYQERYETWDEAAIGHVKACKLAGV